MMRGYLASLSRPGVAACVVLTLLAVDMLGPGEAEVEISDPAVRPPAAAGSEPSVTVATDPAWPSDATSPVDPSATDGPVATVTAPAERGALVEVGPPPIPPAVGLWGKPFAPAGLSRCDEMAWYRAQWGLPDHFDVVGFRESSCRNEVTSSTGCCHGWWQIHRIHIGERHLEHCGIASVADLRGHAPIVKQRQTCAALAVYHAQGSDAWEATW